VAKLCPPDRAAKQSEKLEERAAAEAWIRRRLGILGGWAWWSTRASSIIIINNNNNNLNNNNNKNKNKNDSNIYIYKCTHHFQDNMQQLHLRRLRACAVALASMEKSMPLTTSRLPFHSTKPPQRCRWPLVVEVADGSSSKSMTF